MRARFAVFSTPDVVLVKFRPSTSRAAMASRIAAVNGRAVAARGIWPESATYVIWLWPTRECVASRAVQQLERFPEVLLAMEEYSF